MKVNLKKISGNWASGYALDKHMLHSEFTGYNDYGHPTFNNTRTEAGEAVYRLKYKGDATQVEVLANAVVSNIVPNFELVGLVVPVPASNKRTLQPVYAVANLVAEKLKVASFEDIVIKETGAASTVALKNLDTKEEKVNALKGRFKLNDGITNTGLWNVLVLDDLYDSGASLEAVCAVLGSYSKVKNIYVAALTWK